MGRRVACVVSFELAKRVSLDATSQKRISGSDDLPVETDWGRAALFPAAHPFSQTLSALRSLRARVGDNHGRHTGRSQLLEDSSARLRTNCAAHTAVRPPISLKQQSAIGEGDFVQLAMMQANACRSLLWSEHTRHHLTTAATATEWRDSIYLPPLHLLVNGEYLLLLGLRDGRAA